MESFKEFAANVDDAPHAQANDPVKAAGKKPPPERVNSSASQHVTISSLTNVPTTVPPPDDDSAPLSPVYPQLSNNPPEPESAAAEVKTTDDDEEVLDMPRSFGRAASPSPTALDRNRGALVGKVGDEGAIRMHKFTLYETTNYYYIVGTDLLESAFRILKIDRTADPGELNIIEDDIVYNKKETYQILNAVDEGNRATGGLKLKSGFWGLLGFIKFTHHYYMICVTKRSQVAMIGGHYIYQIDKTEMMALTTSVAAKVKTERHMDESRYVSILNNLDLSRSFYFSYSYDITRTLQFNIMREREALQDSMEGPLGFDHNDMFVWNHHLLGPGKDNLRNPYDWCLSIVHGYIDQSALSVYWGRVVYLTIIARRSRFFAGARYLKRGANDLGYVANDVETEQIVSEMLTTSFHAPGPTLFANPNYTSHVQHRGSIPLHWTQDPSGVSPKPDIHLSVVDPFYSAAALHFDDLFKRYGTPIYVLNLIKSRERIPRESKLGNEYTTAIDYLNQFLPEDKKIYYHAWDMSRASKSRDSDVIGSLESIAEEVLPKTSFFQNGNDAKSGLRLQNGVARTNCVDCLDRTNAAQFVIAKEAFALQLQALGVIEDASIAYDSDAINLFTHMWHDHGDTIAVQYGGSHLVNTMSTYRKINQWQSHSRDMVETFKRYYNNSFMDSQRQEAYNLFLGNYVWNEEGPMLWDLTTDYYLHHAHPRSIFGKQRPSYRHWYTDENLDVPSIPPSIWPQEYRDRPLQYFDDYWAEYYRPLGISSFKKLFSFKMHSNLRYIPISSTQAGKYDLSPFKVRTGHEEDHDSPGKVKRKGVKIITPSEDSGSFPDNASSIDAVLASPSRTDAPLKPSSLGPWLDAQQQLYGPNRKYTGIIKESSFEAPPATPRVPHLPSATFSPDGITLKEPSKAEVAAQAFTSLVTNSLDPQVKPAEASEYERYVRHPSNIPLVTSSQTDYSKAPSEFLAYLSKTQDPSSTTDQLLDYFNEERGGMFNLTLDERAETSLDEYHEFIDSGARDEPLTVLDEDGGKKRYKAYRQWLRGKSLFKQRLIVGGEVV